ncbi:MAG: decaprenyl-phosphate phosphoribosyltransferase [Chloroflexi bacterium]|nr:decaprenyl-phosphate phosphoribosyltransferase [Chloroflexota bacterium]
MTVDSVTPPRGITALAWGLFKAMRPRQFTKNGLILVALFFTVNEWWDPDEIGDVAKIIGTNLAAVGIFTLVTSSIYILNDIADVEKDRAHPKKRFRPIASGVLPVPLAAITGGLFAIGGLALAFVINTEFGLAAVSYIVLMLAYNLFLKHQVILDVMSISAGFVIRAIAGSVAIDGTMIGGKALDLTISPWLYIVTALGALFIAIAKRRTELVHAGDSAGDQRAILKQYTIPFLDMMTAVVTPATLVAYSLYTFGGAFAAANLPDNNAMMLTIPFVVYGIFRYLYLIYVKPTPDAESPEEILLTDKPLILNILAWLITASVVLLANS